MERGRERKEGEMGERGRRERKEGEEGGRGRRRERKEGEMDGERKGDEGEGDGRKRKEREEGGRGRRKRKEGEEGGRISCMCTRLLFVSAHLLCMASSRSWCLLVARIMIPSYCSICVCGKVWM